MTKHHTFVFLVLLSVLILIFTSSWAAGWDASQYPGRHTDLQDASLSGIDLDVTYISREPRYQWDSSKQWPDPGELVTFTAHIINKGTDPSGHYAFEWLIDDHAVASGTGNSISSGEEALHMFQWSWKTGEHFVSFVVDSTNQILETAETNNLLTDPTNAMTIGFWVEEGVYEQFNNIQNGAGTYSWEDWAQGILENMNRMFEESKYPLAPKGAETRVRLDNITIVPNYTLPGQGPWQAPYDTIYDGRWGFSMEEYDNCQCCPTHICYDVPWWVIHELMHYLYDRIDTYAFDVQGGDVKVTDEKGELIAGTPLLPYIAWDVVYYANRRWDMMHYPGDTLFSDYIVYSLNTDWPTGQRTHRSDWSYYILQLPADTQIRVLDNSNQPIANVEVSVYQAQPGDGTSGPYSQNFDDIPDIVGTTDATGRFSLGEQPFGDLEQYGTPVGIVLIKLRHPATSLERYTWLELTDLNLAYWRGETEQYIHDIRFPEGSKQLKLSDNHFSFLGLDSASPAPQTIDVEILGDYVGDWTVSDPTAPWLRIIPSSDIEFRFLPGPLTLIVDNQSMPIGTYTTTLTIEAGFDALDSPQEVSLVLNVIEAEKEYLPVLLYALPNIGE